MPTTDFASQIANFSNPLRFNEENTNNGFDPTNLFGNQSTFDPLRSTNLGGINPGINTGGVNNGGSFLQGFFGTRNNPGFGSQVIGTAGGIANTFLALKQFGLLKDSLKQNKRQFNRQFEAQKQLTNAQIEDRARARFNVNPNNPRPEDVLAERGIR